MNLLKVVSGENGQGASLYKKNPLGARLSVQRCAVFALLEQLADDNEQFFAQRANSSAYTKRLQKAYGEILAYTPAVRDIVQKMQDIAPKYDFDEQTPGNGFRSLVCVCDIVVLHLISISRDCIENCQTMMFRTSYYCKEVESYCAVLRFLLLALQQVINTAEKLPGSSLFPPLSDDYSKYQDLLKRIQALDSSCFYGRPLGFQFSASVGKIFRFIGVVLATYSLSWEKGHGPIGSLINSGRFILSPEQRASRILKVTREADIDFCKGFWNLSELGNDVPKLFCPNMAVNEAREINWVGPITVASNQGGTVRIPEPSAHTGVRPVRIRILSYTHRELLSPPGAPNQQPLSPYLLFHCHGGGYVATSSKSHETYLRTWAKLLNCPVVSVDYSLAPENPFPRPTEEVLYAYAYVINNAALMGWTGEKICMVGDSAGGNLIMSVNLRLIELDVKRKPDGLVLLYTPFLFQYLPSPSRLLSFMDPLLHMGVVLRCVEAYTRGSNAEKQGDDSNSVPSASGNGHKSLQEYVEQVQRAQKSDSVDFESSSSIVSLVNLIPDGSLPENAPPRSPPAKAAKGEDESDMKAASSEEEDDLYDDCASLSAVQVKSDPLCIHLSSNMYDRNLVHYLRTHPLTKDSLVVLGPNGRPENGNEKAGESSLNVEGEEKKPSMSRPSRLSTLLCAPLRSGTTSMPCSPVEGESGSSKMVASQSTHNIAGSTNVPPVHKRSLSQSLVDTAALAAAHAFDNISDWLEYSSASAQSDKPKLDRAASLAPQLAAEMQRAEGEDGPTSYLETLMQREVPRDALISPMYASSECLRQLAPMWFIACHMDPLLDDTISFARKVRACGGRVMSVDLLDSLPHGFLNFTLVSPECREGAKLSLLRIKQALGISDSTSDTS
uniref:Hormone-sensitive lipase n=1 Tax=Ascaris suum TaxID=6253 RepID=F1KVG3_ASCSU